MPYSINGTNVKFFGQIWRRRHANCESFIYRY